MFKCYCGSETKLVKLFNIFRKTDHFQSGICRSMVEWKPNTPRNDYNAQSILMAVTIL